MAQQNLQKNKNLNDDPPEFWPGYGVALVTDLPDPITPEQMRDPGMVETIKKVADEIIRADVMDDAQMLGRRLRLLSAAEKEDPELYHKYEPIWIGMKFVSMPMRKEEEITKLFQAHIVEGINSGLNLKAKLVLAFLFHDVATSEGELPEAILQALGKNEERFGPNSLSVPGQKYAVPQTVKNWIVDYNIFLNSQMRLGTAGGKHGATERISYATRSGNAKRLSQEDREALLKLLELYDFLKFGPSEGQIGYSSTLPATQPAYIKKEKLIIPPVPPPAPQARGTTSPLTSPQPSPRQERGERRVLPRPPVPEVRSQKSPKETLRVPTGQAEVRLRKPEERPLSQPLPTPEEKGRSVVRPPSSDLRISQPDIEDLYRKTLEELRRLRESEIKEGTGSPPSAINEQLIQAGGKGKILGDESGQMGAGKQEKPKQDLETDRNMQSPAGK